MASKIDKAVVKLNKALAGVEDVPQRKAVIDALQGLRDAVNAELGEIRPRTLAGTENPPWVTVPQWIYRRRR